MIAAPATYADWCDLLAARGQRYALPSDMAMLRQVTSHPAWALRLAPSIPLAALAGIVHADHSVIWIATAPEASRSTLPLVRALRALADEQQAAVCRALWANVDDDNAAGRRLVALLGFGRVGKDTWRRACPRW